MKLLAITLNTYISMGRKIEPPKITSVEVKESPKTFSLIKNTRIPHVYVCRFDKCILNKIINRCGTLLLLTDKSEKEAVKLWNEGINGKIKEDTEQHNLNIKNLRTGLIVEEV